MSIDLWGSRVPSCGVCMAVLVVLVVARAVSTVCGLTIHFVCVWLGWDRSARFETSKFYVVVLRVYIGT
jgi:hypothetical protein